MHNLEIEFKLTIPVIISVNTSKVKSEFNYLCLVGLCKHKKAK
jgi:hypothetical protein